MIIFSLASIFQREANLKKILPKILNQCDLLYVNLIGYKNVPDILNNNKIIINNFNSAGSEIRFFNYKDIPSKSYYLTIDDDILYPENYAQNLILNMKKFDNKAVCCIHGSNIDLSLNKNYYLNRKKVIHFSEKLNNIEKVMICGVGTSCFYKENHYINYDNFLYKNMSDVYVSIFLAQQKVPIFSIPRKNKWLIPLNEFNKKIWGNNPHQFIDELIYKNKNLLKNIGGL